MEIRKQHVVDLAGNIYQEWSDQKKEKVGVPKWVSIQILLPIFGGETLISISKW